MTADLAWTSSKPAVVNAPASRIRTSIPRARTESELHQALDEQDYPDLSPSARMRLVRRMQKVDPADISRDEYLTERRKHIVGDSLNAITYADPTPREAMRNILRAQHDQT